MIQTVRFTEWTEEDEEIEHELPAKRAVCPGCDGEGRHVNPAIDGHGITAGEWDRDWDDEEREGYFNGRYDVVCHTCKGLRVVTVVDEERAESECPELLRLYWDIQEERAAYERLCASERRMGA
jgi:hypothetical protein